MRSRIHKVRMNKIFYSSSFREINKRSIEAIKQSVFPVRAGKPTHNKLTDEYLESDKIESLQN